MAGKRRKYRLKKRWPRLIFILFAFLMLGGGYVYAMNWLYPAPSDARGPMEQPGDQVDEGPKLEERINLLLLGMDAREGETKSRTDSIILASIDPASKQAAMLSIPRDTRVEIPGRGLDRINAANVYGGPDLAVETVEKLLGVSVDNYVLTNFNGFKDIVDVLGGVTIDVEKNMYYYDPTDNFQINLKKGTQQMDGDKAIQYVRFRNDAMGDISRTARQQKFLEALVKETLQPATITKLHKLVPEIKENVQTNLGVLDMLALARAAKDLNNLDIVTETLPGRFMDIEGLSYWGVDPAEAKQVVAQLFKGEKVSSVISGPTVTVAAKDKDDSKKKPDEELKEPEDEERSTEKKTEAGPEDEGDEGNLSEDEVSEDEEMPDNPDSNIVITPVETGDAQEAEEDPADDRSGEQSSEAEKDVNENDVQEEDSTPAGEPAAGSPEQDDAADKTPSEPAAGSTEMPAWLSGSAS